MSIFKNDILKIIRPLKRSVFNIYDPIGVKRLFKLRVGLSPLRYHKKRYNFRDTPNDLCQCQVSAETTEHFLLHCDIFEMVRNSMFVVINPILEFNGLRFLEHNRFVKFLLYGHETLRADENKVVLSATLKFIHESNRFELANE